MKVRKRWEHVRKGELLRLKTSAGEAGVVNKV